MANGNKPPAKFANPFTRRVAKNSRIAYYPYPGPLCGAIPFFIVDQLLVGQAALGSSEVEGQLKKVATPTGANVFDGSWPDDKNVQVWKLKKVSGEHGHPDVADAVWSLRKSLQKELLKLKLGPEQISPNHVLIPSPNYHECPWGPPGEHGPVSIPAEVDPPVNVAVIDSGYLPEGPITGRLAGAHPGNWLDPSANPQWQPGRFFDPTKDHLDQNGDGHLDAVAGHANFVAGVVARYCPNARITVVSDNASFLNTGDDNPTIPTEAAVARSLWEQRDNDVINVGYAFPTLPDTQLTKASKIKAASGPPSWPLKAVLDELKKSGRVKYIVAPAGNQNCTVPQYPAAFGVQGYDNVIGVGSVGAGNQRSVFSNHGDSNLEWVRCCAAGEHVVSTFIGHWDGPAEDPEQPAGGNPRKRFNGWAWWSGTSFASPKVAAALAHRVALKTPDPWEDLTTGPAAGPNPWEDMGYLLKLAPY